jgi:hypothetical protein
LLPVLKWWQQEEQRGGRWEIQEQLQLDGVGNPTALCNDMGQDLHSAPDPTEGKGSEVLEETKRNK